MKSNQENLIRKIVGQSAEAYTASFLEPEISNNDIEENMAYFSKREEEVENESENFLKKLEYEPFDASQEIAKVKELKKELRLNALSEYKHKLIEQKKGIAETIRTLRQAIESSNQFSIEDLYRLIEKPSIQYRFTAEQVACFFESINQLNEKHIAIKKTRRKYKNNEELFEKCFAVKPKGSIEVTEGSISLCFKCFDKDDYFFATNYELHRGNKEKIEKIKPLDNGSYGRAVSVGIPELYATVIAINVGGIRDHFPPLEADNMLKEAQIHEEQHIFNRLFIPNENKWNNLQIKNAAIENARNPDEAIHNLIRGLVRIQRKFIGIDFMAKDEILAHYKGGRGVSEIFLQLATSELYDYAELFSRRIKLIPKYTSNLLDDLVCEAYYENIEDSLPQKIASLKIPESEIDKYVASVFKEEYESDLEKWISSISDLESKGYTRDEIIDLLYQEPVNSWSNLVRRIAKKKEE